MTNLAAQPRPWKLALILAITAAFCIPILLHVPHINGNPYWLWPYRRLHLYPLLPLMLSAVIPFVLAQFLFQRNRISAPAATLLLAISTLFLRYVAAVCVADPPSLSVVTRIVEHRTTFSYYHDAVRVGHDVAAGRLTWNYVIEHYPTLMSNLSMHTRIRPPGGILISKTLIELFGNPAAASALALLIAIVSSLAPPMVYWMMRRLSRTPGESLAAASLLTLCPGFLLFFPMFDPMYVTASALMVVLWTKALDADVPRAALWALLLGLLLGLCLFVTYNFLVLGIFLGSLALLKLGSSRQDRSTFIACLSLVATIVIFYLALWRITGFDPISTMGSALANEHRTKVVLDRLRIHSQFWDLFDDFSLASAHLGIPLSLMYVFSRATRREKFIPILALLQILVVDLIEVLPFETTRVWLFLLPMLLISAGRRAGRGGRPSRAQSRTFACL